MGVIAGALPRTRNNTVQAIVEEPRNYSPPGSGLQARNLPYSGTEVGQSEATTTFGGALSSVYQSRMDRNTQPLGIRLN